MSQQPVRSANASAGTALRMLQTVFITALMLLFGVTTYTLVSVGGDSYRRVMASRDANADARVALSYISMRVRQNDTAGALAIDAANDALMLRFPVGDTVYESRIYSYEGGLYECFIDAESPFNPLDGDYLTPLDGLELSAEDTPGGTLLRVRLWVGGDERSLSLLMRSAPAEGGAP